MTISIGHSEDYYSQRNIKLDLRGELIIDPSSQWGFDVTVFTQSHSVNDWKDSGFDSIAYTRPVIVEGKTWICSHSILYNCIIREGAIVAIGSVVRSQEVAPWTMVAGNPARVIARWVDGKWRYAGPKWEVLE